MNNITGRKNVCTEVVGKNLCIGCGICASICPRENLKIEFNRFGEYNAFEIGNSCEGKCHLCLEVCPFYNNKDNEDTLGKKLFAETPGIKHTPETGYYLDAFVGYSSVKSHREHGASGGIATWTLETLLKENLVDHVACVSPNYDPEKLFKFKICNTPEEVRECSRSCYYPVETSEVIKHILSHKGRYGIIALPCMCKAVRLAMQLIPKLKHRIRFMLGLVCGQTKSKFFVEYICALGGGDPHYLKQVRFRIKDPNRPASDFGMKFVCGARTNAALEGVVYRTEGMNQAWGDRYFTPNACNFCDDIFAELADISFMDAWLEEYSRDPKGHSLVLTRDSRVNELFTRESESPMGTSLRRISIDLVIRSQLGVLCSKRACMRDRMSLLREEGLQVPVKRWNTGTPIRPLGIWRLNAAQYRMSRRSGIVWTGVGKDLDAFTSEMHDLREELDRARRRYLSYRIPNAALRKVGLYRQWARTRFYS